MYIQIIFSNVKDTKYFFYIFMYHKCIFLLQIQYNFFELKIILIWTKKINTVVMTITDSGFDIFYKKNCYSFDVFLREKIVSDKHVFNFFTRKENWRKWKMEKKNIFLFLNTPFKYQPDTRNDRK